MIAADANHSISDIVKIKKRLKTNKIFLNEINHDIEAGSRELFKLVGGADGLRLSAHSLQNIINFSNTMFNIMRGGIFDNNYQMTRTDFLNYLVKANKSVVVEKKSRFDFYSFNTVAAFTYFIIVFFLFNGVSGPDGAWWWLTLFGSVGALVTSFLVIPAVTILSSKIGKKRSFVVSQSISIFGYILLWFLFIPGKPYMFLFVLPFFSFGIGGLFTLIMSMTADVIDLAELNTGKHREGIFGAL